MIVSVADLSAWLGVEEGDDADRDALLAALLTRVEAQFLAACGRTDRPFLTTPATGLVETLDGTGTGTLFVSRPVTSVTQILIGDPAAPRLTLDASALVVQPGRTMLRAKAAGVTFGTVDEPGAVRVTYAADAEAPADVHQAILRAAAAMYLQRGAEDVRAESEGGVRSEFAAAFDDPSWMTAVAVHREPALG